MTPGQTKARKALERARKAADDYRIELAASIREFDEAIAMDLDGLGNEEPTRPGVPRPSSRTMPAVTGLAEKVGSILEGGKKP